eukprot:m.93763 g.93763  ORF g.93763 m.93763 type:complete len:463 (+) comp36800_c0_seq2:647-2035(+)
MGNLITGDQTATKSVYHDISVNCWPSALCGKDGKWNVVLRTEETFVDTPPRMVLGVLGCHGRGKTWALSRICGEDSSAFEKNAGLGFKWTTRPGAIAIDAPGRNNPLHLIRKPDIENRHNRAQEMKEYEDFVLSATLSLSNMIVFVVNETRECDLRYFSEVLEEWKALCKEDSLWRRREIALVHNFRNIKTVTDRSELLTKTLKIYHAIADTDAYIRPFALMSDFSYKGKEENKSAFKAVGSWIEDFGERQRKDKESSILHQFASIASPLLSKGILANFKELKFEKDSNRFVPIKSSNEDPITRRRYPQDRICAWRMVRPPAAVYEYTSKLDTPCFVIHLELPGLKKDQIVVAEKKEESVEGGFSAVEVYGKKEERSILESLRSSKTIAGKEGLIPAESCALTCYVNNFEFNEFRRIFQIPLRFDSSNCTKVCPKDGTVILLFSRRLVGSGSDDQSSDCSKY